MEIGHNPSEIRVSSWGSSPGFGCFGQQWQMVSNPWSAATLAQQPGAVEYIEPLPEIRRPAANDYAALRQFYDNGMIEQDTVEFAPGIQSSDLVFSWGQTTLATTSGPGGVPESHATIDISWNGGAGRARLVIPNADDPLGAGIERVKFSDGSALRMEDLIALAPPAPLDLRNSDTALVGTEQSDSLRGGWGNDVLWGGNGDDILQGGEGDDTLAGGADVDMLYGGAGNDTYTFNFGDGWEAIFDTVSASEGNRIVFGAGITPADLTFMVDNGYLLMLVGNGGDAIEFMRFNVLDVYGAHAVDTFEFSDGSVCSYRDLVASRGFDISANFVNGVLLGTNGNDRINGGNGSDTLIGGAGNDTLAGGLGNDTYVFNPGNGVDTIIDCAGENNTLVFGAGIDPASITLSLGSLLLDLGNGDAVHIQSFDPNNVYAAPAIGSFQFADGTVQSYSQLVARGFDIAGTAANDVLTGTDVVDRMLGGDGSDTLSGGAGDDVLNSGAGNDTLNGGAGADTMMGGQGNDSYLVDDVNDIIGEGAGEGTDSVSSTVSHALNDNVENLFLQGGWNAALNGIGNASDNSLQGSPGPNLLVGGGGNDVLFGYAGNDIMQGGGGNDRLSDAAGCNLFDGGAGMDTLMGTFCSEIFFGGSGNDTLTTGLGADILAFNLGDGQDTVVASTATDNAISLGGGIRYSDLRLSKSGNNLILKAGVSDQLTLQNWYTTVSNHSVFNLQVIVDASADYDALSSDPLLNQKVQRFNFNTLASHFDAAGAPNDWAVMNDLLNVHLAGSDTDALGGDLAYQYGKAGTLAGIALTAAQGILAAPGFGSSAQALQPLADLQNGAVRLG